MFNWSKLEGLRVRHHGHLFLPTGELVKEKERIDVLCSMQVEVGGEKKEVLRWCQGQVTQERKNQEFPTVVVKWDKCEDIKGWERGGVGDQVLKDHLYNKDKKNAWRLDVDADCFKEVGSTDCPEGADEDLRDKCSDSDDEDSCENDSSSEENDSDVDEEDDEEEEEDSED